MRKPIQPSCSFTVVLVTGFCLALLLAPPVGAGTTRLWENTIPTPNHLYDVVRFSDGTVWACGPAGTVVRWDGTVWDTLWGAHWLLDEGDIVEGLWGTSSTDVWAVSYLGQVLHFDGSAWSLEWTAGQRLGAIWGSSSSDIWIAGRNGYTAHYDGTSWADVTSAASNFIRALWGADSNDVWAAGEGGEVMRWNGSSWNAMPTGTTEGLLDIWGSTSWDVWIVGNNGTILHWDGGGLAAVTPPASLSFAAVSGFGLNDVFVAGTSGLASTIYHWDGSSWTEAASTVPWIQAMAHDHGGTGSLYAVGGQGLVVSGGASGWEEVSTGDRDGLNGIWMTGSLNGMAVGDSGTILRKTGWAWEALSSGVTADLLDVWAPARDHAFAVGTGGTLLEWDGTDWSAVGTGVTADVVGIHGWASGEAVAVSNVGDLLRYDGSSWAVEDISGEVTEPTDVWGPSQDFLVVTSADGFVATWDGSVWSSVPVDPGTVLTCVNGRGPNDVFVAGEGGAVFHWDGSAWSDISPSGITADFTGVHTTADLAFFTDASGELAVYGYGTWGTPVRYLGSGGLAAIHGWGDWVWLAGGSGAILRRGTSSIGVFPASAEEGETATFLIRSDDPVDTSTDEKIVDYETVAITATEGTDYTAASGTATIGGGTNHTKSWTTVEVPTLDDSTDEPAEMFRLELSNPVDGALLESSAVGTITDDDPPAEVSIADVTVDETAGQAVVPVTISPPSGWPVTIHVTSADGTATAPADYTPKDRDITIPPGTGTWNLLFSIVDDTEEESDETFTVTITSVTNADLVDGTGTVTIEDDDNPCGAPGDADGDCVVAAADLALVIRLIDTPAVGADGDPDCDGSGGITRGDLFCTLTKIFNS